MTRERWLLVEDEPDIYDMLIHLYNLLGAHAIAFVDGESAISWIEEQEREQEPENLPTLALIDIRLPGKIDGVTVSTYLRQSPLLGNIPIVLTTAFHLSPEQERKVMERSGADLLLYKPLPITGELRILLNKLIQGRNKS